jgi:chemotaxis protein methyltransferase WspC
VIVARIEALLKERMGLDASSIGTMAIDSAVRERTAACGLQHRQAYWDYLVTSQGEVQELIEAVIVPETWFFRDREAFGALTRMAMTEWLPAHPSGTMQLLSVPCSTGEEPFSIAMALVDAGFPADRMRIEAADISLRVIVQAQQASYGKNSFRGADLVFRDRHFVPDGRRYRLRDEVRRHVRFRQANLLANGAFPAAQTYDAIFCRNVLIYFDGPHRNVAVRLLTRLLAPTGMLYVGPSESALMLDHGFESVRMPLAFAFRRAGAATSAEPAPAAQPVPGRLPSKTDTRAGEIDRAGGSDRIDSGRVASDGGRGTRDGSPIASEGDSRIDDPVRAGALITPAAASWIDVAQQLADSGKLPEAMALCEANLDESAPSPQAYYLMGLLHDAAGRPQHAAEHYRKALYLDPTHHEALVHLGTALMRDGDATAAQRLFDRAKRSQRGGG